MASSSIQLPENLSNETIDALLTSINLPKALSIHSPNVTAAYHSIYRIEIPPCDTTTHTDLILRISGNQLPKIKTQNEVGVMSWISQNTSIPIPDVIAYDATTENPLGHEYTLLSCCQGVTISDIYASLTEEQLLNIIDQLIDVLVQLHSHEWYEIGGLKRTEAGDIIVAQVLDETFWQNPDIDTFWPAGEETVTSLNIKGPYPTYTAWISAQIQKYVELIQKHETFSSLRNSDINLIPRLLAFLKTLPNHTADLNNTKLRLAHKDLHFANILYNSSTDKITAILDWEFSGVVPMPRWNPSRAFLWNGKQGQDAYVEKNRLMDVFSRRCEEREVKYLVDDAAFTSPFQEAMQMVATYLRAVTEVVPRGQSADLVPGWIDVVKENLSKFGV